MTPAIAAAEATLPRHVRRAINRLASARAQAYEAELRQALLLAAARRWHGRSYWLLGDVPLVELAAQDVLGLEARP